MTDRLKHLTSISGDEHAERDAIKARMLKAASDAAPNGRVRLTLDWPSLTLEIEPQEAEPCPES